eukprot:TRINITY_DN45993_c0_g1_i1.p1 TRINITY_DN45993_c0_g1~~TRINITY_DN45993_c0_g1_i1.p1  ORF type:complete len:116 (-),score=14.07 TRINITY_DN45993_c0_g1_i1:537-836(-)
MSSAMALHRKSVSHAFSLTTRGLSRRSSIHASADMVEVAQRLQAGPHKALTSGLGKCGRRCSECPLMSSCAHSKEAPATGKASTSSRVKELSPASIPPE